MDLNDVQLPALMIADLYRYSLIDPGETQQMKEPVAESESSLKENAGPTWKSLGNNQKNILIVVDHAQTAFLPDDEMNLLTGILNACKLSVADVAIVNLDHYRGILYKEFVNHFKSKSVLLFGIEPAVFGLPMSFPQFQVQAFTGISFLYAPVLKAMESDKILKSKLWLALRRLFNI